MILRWRSALYREVIEPIGGRHVLRVGVSLQGKPLGLLALVRGRSERGFQPSEITRVAEAASPLVQLLAEPVDEDERRLLGEGFMVLSAQGELLQACAEGERLWRMLNNDCFLPRLDATVLLPTLCAFLRQGGASPVRRTFRNGWGQFELIAARLRSTRAGGVPDAIHLRVQHWALARMVHLRRMEALQLSSMQKRVCMEVLRNQTQTEIAQALEISPQTVISHVRDIYNKARVASRQELFRVFG